MPRHAVFPERSVFAKRLESTEHLTVAERPLCTEHPLPGQAVFTERSLPVEHEPGAARLVCAEHFMFTHIVCTETPVCAEHLVCAVTVCSVSRISRADPALPAPGARGPRLTTLQPTQSGPFSQVLRRAWMPPPHWAVHRSQGPQPVQNTCGGHSRCSLQYLYRGRREERKPVSAA